MTLDETFKAAKAGDLTNDTTYKVGEISRKTGLQKQPDGSWAPPKKTNYGKVTTNKNGEVGIQQTLGKGSKFEKFGSEKEAARALGNYTAGYNTTERSKEDPHSNEALLHKHWDKETEQIRKENKQADMKKEVLEYLSHTMARENAEAFLDKASPKMLRTMYNNLKYKIPGENKDLHEKEAAALKTFNKITGSKEKDFNTLKSKYDKELARGMGSAPAASSETQNSAAAFKGKSINNFKDYAKANGLRMYTAAPGSNGPDSTVERYTDSRNLHTVFVNYDDKTGQITSVEENFRKLTLPETKGHSPRGVDKLMAEAGYEAAGWDEANSESKWKDETGKIVKVHFDRFGHADKVTKDAAYTAESVNAPRENLESKLTGDCKIRIRK